MLYGAWVPEQPDSRLKFRAIVEGANMRECSQELQYSNTTNIDVQILSSLMKVHIGSKRRWDCIVVLLY